jgi:hypothetical protein
MADGKCKGGISHIMFAKDGIETLSKIHEKISRSPLIL